MRSGLTVGLAVTSLVALGLAAASQSFAAPVASPTLVQASNLSSTNGNQNVAHADTAVATNGTTLVSTFSVGQATDGFGASDIGFSTSNDNGRTWTDGLLPGLTADSPGTPLPNIPRAVDSTVAWDAKNAKWIIPSVGYVDNSPNTPAFLERAIRVNTSADGLTWAAPVTVINNGNINADKPWVACDNTTSSPNYGTCYIAFTERNFPGVGSYSGWVKKSTDGGATWGTAVQIPYGSLNTLYNMIPAVQPNGNVVVVGTENNGDAGAEVFSSVSTDGGASFGTPTGIASISLHNNPDGTSVREQNKVSVAVDDTGRITAIWSDCRFGANCGANSGTNQLVMVSSGNGTVWTAPAKVTIPGATGNEYGGAIAVRPGTTGATAQLSVIYDNVVTCGANTCINTNYSTSYDGGTTWSAPYTINPVPMDVTWVSSNPRGADLGDYNQLTFLQGAAVTTVPLALSAPNAGTFAQAEYGFSTPVDFLKPAVTPPPAVRPDTTITKHPKKKVFLVGHHHKAKVKFKFTSTVAGSTFQCRFGLKPWKACNSGKAVYKATAGRHKFKVRATANGLTDLTKATFVVTVVRKH